MANGLFLRNLEKYSEVSILERLSKNTWGVPILNFSFISLIIFLSICDRYLPSYKNKQFDLQRESVVRFLSDGEHWR